MSETARAETQKGAIAPGRAMRGRPALAIVLGLLAAAGAAGLAWMLRSSAPSWLIGVLGVLAAIGLLGIFAWIAGFITFGSDPQQRAFFDALMDSLSEACVVTDGRGRAVYANSQFIKLVSGAGIGRLVGVENLYAGYPDASERVYRLAQAAREGQSRQEEFRLAGGSAAAGAQPDRPVWIRVSVVPTTDASGQTLTFWRHQDITADREKQERAFAHLQYIISYLDRAPAGFFSAGADGRIAYANATLAGWLGLGLEETTGGSLSLSDIVTESGIKLLAGVAPKPGEELTETFDLDLSARDGRIAGADAQWRGYRRPCRGARRSQAVAAFQQCADRDCRYRRKRRHPERQSRLHLAFGARPARRGPGQYCFRQSASGGRRGA